MCVPSRHSTWLNLGSELGILCYLGPPIYHAVCCLHDWKSGCRAPERRRGRTSSPGKVCTSLGPDLFSHNNSVEQMPFVSNVSTMMRKSWLECTCPLGLLFCTAPILSNCSILAETSCDAALQQDILTNRSSSSSSPYLAQLVVQVTTFLQLQCIETASRNQGV